MKNITLALDEKIIKKGREYARRHNLTLNALVRRLLEQTVENDAAAWLEESFRLMDSVKIGKNAESWTREDLHRG